MARLPEQANQVMSPFAAIKFPGVAMERATELSILGAGTSEFRDPISSEELCLDCTGVLGHLQTVLLGLIAGIRATRRAA